MVDADLLANEFIKVYMETCGTDPLRLAAMYHEQSLLVFEGEKIQGRTDICAKLNKVFKTVKFAGTTVDALPTPDGSIVITVIGQLKDDSQERPMGFTQNFVLKNSPNEAWEIVDHIFRLTLHNF